RSSVIWLIAVAIKFGVDSSSGFKITSGVIRLLMLPDFKCASAGIFQVVQSFHALAVISKTANACPFSTVW
ncbi:hypothetical protein ACSLNL_27180, partial [Escherichia coli]|uniref:hypothetical protein n=1 Tax=Escherichia coli TaxID=562 RepID=UPI003EE127B7